MIRPDPHVPGLKIQAFREAVGHWGLLLVFFGVLYALSGPRGAIPGALCAGAVLASVHGLLGYRFATGRPGGVIAPAPRLGTANRLTLLRGLMISLTAGFLAIRPGDSGAAAFLTWLPGGLYLTAAVLDGVDGAWARRTGTQSRLGGKLDGDMDALGVLVACGVAVAGGRLPVYYLAAGLVYYAYQLDLWRRRRRGARLHPLPPRGFARLVAGIQMGFLGVALLPLVGADVLALAAPFFLAPLLAGFAWDWLHVTGRFEGRAGGVGPVVRRRLAAVGPKGGRVLLMGAVAGLFIWAWRDVSPASVWAAVARWSGPQWLLFAGINLVILWAMCWRWWLILRRMGHAVGFPPLVAYRMAANTLSYLTPGPQFGGEPIQVFCLERRHGVPRAAAAAAVAVDRLSELMGSFVFLAVCALFVLPPLLDGRAALVTTTLLMGGAVLAAGGLLFGIARGHAPLSRAAARMARLVPPGGRWSGLAAFLQTGEQQAAAVLTGGLPGWYGAIGVVQWMAFLAELWVIYAFLGLALTPREFLTMAVAARLAFLLPLPGGLGALEAGQVLALTGLGGDPALAAAACAVMRVRDGVTIGMGGVLTAYWLRPKRLRNAA